MTTKNCFFNKDRVCDLTCKAAFEVDDPVDPVDCYFIWLASHFGEGLYDLRKMMEMGLGVSGAMGFGGGPANPPPAGPASHGGKTSKN